MRNKMKNIVGMEKQDTAFLLSAFSFLLPSFCFLLSAFCFPLSHFCFLISAFSFLLSPLLHYLVILLGIGTGGVVEMPPFCS